MWANVTGFRLVGAGALLALLMGADGGGTADGALVGMLREFGFPIFVSLWFMWRVEKRLDRFTEALQNLLTAVTIMAKTMDGWEPETAKKTKESA